MNSLDDKEDYIRNYSVKEEYLESLNELKKEGTVSGNEFEEKFEVRL